MTKKQEFVSSDNSFREIYKHFPNALPQSIENINYHFCKLSFQIALRVG